MIEKGCPAVLSDRLDPFYPSLLVVEVGRRVAVDVKGVDEPVASHHPGTGEPELDDLRGGEVLTQPLVELIVHGVVVGGEQVEEFDGHLLLSGERAVTRREQA